MPQGYPNAVSSSVVASDWTTITNSLHILWPRICDVALAYLLYFPQRAAAVDRIRIYVRPDSGDLFVAVCPKPPRRHDGEIGHVIIPHFEAEYFNIKASDDFEQRHESLISQMAAAIKTAWSPELSPLPITVVQYSDLETERFLADVDVRTVT